MASKIASKSLPSIVAFVSVLILKGIYAIEDLSFTQEPSGTVVLRNQLLTLGCSVTGLPPLTVQWLYNGQPISPSEDRHVLANGSLFLPSVLPKRDSGEYQCCVSNEVGRICSCPATVTVSNVPRYSVVQLPDTVQRGGVLRLECSSEGALPISGVIWKLGKALVSEDQRKNILPSGVLQVSSVETGDAGNYRCLTNNVAERRIKSPSYSVLVQEPAVPLDDSRGPVIVGSPRDHRVLEGETVLFECFADGGALRVTWSREDGRPIRTQDVNYLGGSNLQLLKVTAEDEAVYVCTAENTATGVSVQAQAQLFIVVPPAFRVSPTRFFGPLGSTVRFSCSATGIPAPTIRWLHNGNPAALDSRVVQQPSDDLVFIGVRRQDMGTVQCVAENKGGSIQAGAELEVRIDGNPPDPPQNIRLLSVNPNTVMVTWTPPTRLRSQIIAYSVHYKAVKDGIGQQAIHDSEDTQVMIEDLSPHTNYSFYMQSWTTNGPSEESKRHYILTEQSRPSFAPRFTAASNTPTTVTLNWQPLPDKFRHGVIVRYRITVRETGETQSQDTMVNNASLTEFTVEGLLAGQIYQVRMAAATTEGFGVSSDWVTVQTRVPGDLRPEAPQFETVNLNFTTISVRPHPPQPSEMNLLGLKLFYSVYDADSGLGAATEPILLPLNTTEYIITGLEPDTTYVIKLLAYTIASDGHETVQDVRTTSKPGVPNQFLESPTSLAVQSLSSRAVRLSWQAPVTNQLVTGYIVRYWPQGNRSQTELPIQLDLEKNNSISELILEGLDPFTTYVFDVCSVSTKLSGPFCDARVAKTLEDRPSTPPEDILAKPLDPHAVELQWQPPMQPNGIITHYVILYDEDVSKPEDTWHSQARNGTAHHSTVDGLASDTKYYFKVRAGTQVGEGPPTNTVAAQTLTAKTGVGSKPWQESMLIGVCSAFVLIVMLVFVVICKKRGLLKQAHPNASCHNHTGGANSAVCTGYAARPSPDGRMYVMGSGDGTEQNGFIPMRSVLPQPSNLDTKGGTPLIINGNGPVRSHYHHHGPAGGVGMVIPSRFPRPPGPCSADPDASSMALLPGSESVTNSDLGEDNSQGKSEASSSSGGFSAFSQDPNHRTVAKLPHCSSCCLGPCPQLSDSSTGSYGEPMMGSKVTRVLPSSPSPPSPQQPLPQSQGVCHAAHTGVNICGGGGGNGSCEGSGSSGYYSDGRSPPGCRSSPPAPGLPRNELTWPRHTGRVLGKAEGTGGRTGPSSVWEKQTVSDGVISPSGQSTNAAPSACASSNGALGDHGSTDPESLGQDTSPDFLDRVLDELSSGSCSTTV
ncbi:immunoglobulin superfamily DCC subclass member 4-like [Patiria miniata]|uniref:Uncharacterized protein n=1 Tax=Patiria miniata TaxID=46514 RepID=A0A914BU73_PATMI|nr:immunoglobulin superfamily DCC subclass member 4-like [Patiria miniata]